MIASILLQAAAGGGGIPTIVMFVGMFAIAYLFMFRPQMKRQKEAKAFQGRRQKRGPSGDHWRTAWQNRVGQRKNGGPRI